MLDSLIQLAETRLIGSVFLETIYCINWQCTLAYFWTQLSTWIGTMVRKIDHLFRTEGRMPCKVSPLGSDSPQWYFLHRQDWNLPLLLWWRAGSSDQWRSHCPHPPFVCFQQEFAISQFFRETAPCFVRGLGVRLVQPHPRVSQQRRPPCQLLSIPLMSCSLDSFV